MTVIRLDIIGGCAIEVDGFRVTPASSHLFGLLLFLSLRDGRPASRKELQALLGDNDSSAPASHNLRQLLYRLRGMGLRFAEEPMGLTLEDATLVGPLDELRRMAPRDRCRLASTAFDVLPGYAPRLPRPFLSWLDEAKSGLEGELRRLLLVDLEILRTSHAWADLDHLCVKLASLDAANEEIVRCHAEALAMMGRRDQAVTLIDGFLAETMPTGESLASLRSVRRRISKATLTRREGTLRARESCMTLLASEWERAASGGARMTAILGVAGMGKTRVAEEFASRIAIEGGHVLRFECDSQARQQPLSLFSHILPALRGMRGSLGASPEFRASLALVRRASDETAPTIQDGLSLEARRTDIQAGLIDLFEAVTSERAMLLVVDDAHLLDEASRAVLRALTMSRNTARLQVLACVRPSSGNTSLVVPGRRISAHELLPLSRQESLDLLLELGSRSCPDDAHIEWCLGQAAGNPFYLHRLATHQPSLALPFDIGSLALSSYSSLPPISRTLLEACLLLGRFATMDRAMFVAGTDDMSTLSALRELEEQALVHFVDGRLGGPHALLHDALRALIPSTVSALLHRRIAARLEDECISEHFKPELAWASAQGWLAAGDPTAACRLLRHCARHAADLGEPAAAIDLLSQLPKNALPPKLLADLLDDLTEFASVGAAPGVAETALRDRLALAQQDGGDRNRIRSLELQLIEAELFNGGARSVAYPRLMALLTDPLAHGEVRVQAGTRLIALADSDLDSALASTAYSSLQTIESRDQPLEALLGAAGLIYHSSFGNYDIAYQLASKLLALHPHPTRSPETIRPRMYVALALCRIGYPDEAWAVCEPEYHHMMRQRLYGEALYAASIIADIAIASGDFEAAERWFNNSKSAIRHDTPHELNPTSGFGFVAGSLAMRQGRYEEAKEHFRAPARQYQILAGARFRSVMLSRLLRIQQLSCGINLDREDVYALRELYERGKSLGGQDATVEALWCASILDGDSTSASQLLRDYLFLHRRERSVPEWALRHSSAADDVWQEYDFRTARARMR